MAEITDAVSQAARVGEIGFADFTAQLVRDVFRALLDTNIEQTQVYIELVERVAAGLATYINTTKDDIGPEEIAQFIALLPDTIQLEAGQSLTAAQAEEINDRTRTAPDAGITDDNRVAVAGELNAGAVTKIRDAIATRIAANRYTLLERMVRQGITRLVVDHGLIESRLTFHTYSRATVSTQRHSRTIGGGGLIAGAVGGLAGIVGSGVAGGIGGFSGGGAALSVSTTNTLDRDVSGSSVQIYGRVRIAFKTDYVPLAT